ncbi:hypothetical protein ACHWQZ_G017569 [Mnemiopsis leidyi]
MKDRFTKYVQLVPLIDGTSQKIAKALMDHWFFTFGIPEKILSDRANNLTGELMQSVYNIFQVNKIRTTSYHARGNGDCERANKDISIILKKLVKDNYSSWPNKLPYVSFAINTAVHASTGFSPARLQFGRELRTPSDLWFSTTSTETYKSGAHLALATYHDLNEVYKLVRSNLNQSQAGQKKTYDRKKGFHTNYKEKDLVLVWKPLSPAVKDYRKFRNCYSGPWQIKKVLSQWTYLVQHIHNSKLCVVHFDTLKLIPSSLRSTFHAPAGTTTKVAEPCIDPSRPDDLDDTLQLMFGTSTKTQPTIQTTPMTSGNSSDPEPPEIDRPTDNSRGAPRAGSGSARLSLYDGHSHHRTYSGRKSARTGQRILASPRNDVSLSPDIVLISNPTLTNDTVRMSATSMPHTSPPSTSPPSYGQQQFVVHMPETPRTRAVVLPPLDNIAQHSDTSSF